MSVIKQVQSKIALPTKAVEESKKGETAVKAAPSEVTTDEKGEAVSKDTGKSKKFCHFCKTKTEPRYWDTASLRRLVNDRGRIVARGRSGSCAKHQRHISREIKRARHLALLPFTVSIR